MSKPKTPRHNPKAKPGSLQRIVRHTKVHHSKFSCPRLCKNTAATVRSLCRECNRKTGKRKSASIRVIRGQNPSGPPYLTSRSCPWCMLAAERQRWATGMSRHWRCNWYWADRLIPVRSTDLFEIPRFITQNSAAKTSGLAGTAGAATAHANW